MSRLEPTFSALKAEGRKALIPYVCAGDPSGDATLSLMHAMAEAGADIIELGVPFSDPMADGPVIQRAAERALEAGMSLAGVLDIVRRFRTDDADTPIVLMGYLNPIEAMGYEAFAAAAADANVDGVLVVDLPPEEGEGLGKALRTHDLDPIFLLSPTTTDERIAKICQYASGYVYYVSLKGVTGAANLDVGDVAEQVGRIRAQTSLPVGVGFGISDADSASRVASVADAVVVGSALVRRIEEKMSRPEAIDGHVSALIAQMRAAMNAA